MVSVARDWPDQPVTNTAATNIRRLKALIVSLIVGMAARV
jgi:hypothetical protein